jgi:exodeoxyribonuclease VII large subunit
LNAPLFEYLFDETERRPMTVSELNAEVKAAVERGFASVWVEGEVVDFRKASSGHWYFSLNDGTSQVKCVCWKGTNFRIRYTPGDGDVVRIRGRLTFWEAKGELKLTVDSLEPSGEGALRAAFEQIKARLEAEGLFAAELKRPIPFFPRRVGVVTSRSGAAFHDIVHVLTRRARSVSIVLAPSLVQGEGAADSIRRAIIAMNKYSLVATTRIDVLIVGRGGGSAEDLWAFNDEALARAVRESLIPVISAVGHEIDWTICDHVADLRAATPSAAAEMVAAREEDILATLDARRQHLASAMEMMSFAAATRLENAMSELHTTFGDAVQTANARFTQLSARLSPATLNAKAAAARNALDRLDNGRDVAMDRRVKAAREALGITAATLDALSPLKVLTRGYSITQDAEGRVLRDASAVKPGDKLNIKLDRGKLNAEVLSSESE